MSKRGTNIYKRKDGRWEGRYKCGYKADGKVKYASVYGKSYSFVKEIIDKKRAESDKCALPCKNTVGEILNLWFSDIKNKIKKSTLANYEMKLKKHILPYFAGLRYDLMTVETLNNFINLKCSSGLSVKYVSDIVAILKSAAKFANRSYNCVNRIEYITLPKNFDIKKKPILSLSEQEKLYSALNGSNSISQIGILLAGKTGIRIGELCALRWEDIDFEKRTFTVKKTVQRIWQPEGGTSLIIAQPKSRKSVREIPLPDFLLSALSKQRKNNGYFLSCSEKIIEPRTMQYRFKSLLKKLNLPNINFHSLRHIFATNCISLGFDIKTLSEILGHSSVEITLNRYVHSSIERKRECMNLIK